MAKPIDRTSLAEQAAQILLEYIQDQGLRDGDPIPATAELAETLGVSRPVIREAIAALSGLGLISRSQGRESVVATPGSLQLETMLRHRFQVTGTDLVDVQEFREVVEVSSARLAAERATTEGLAELKAALENLRSVHTDEELHDADVAFHRQVAVIAKNDLLLLTIDSIAPLLRALRTKVWAGWVAAGGGTTEVVEAHADVYDAIAAGDADAAAHAMMVNLYQARTGLEAHSAGTSIKTSSEAEPT